MAQLVTLPITSRLITPEAFGAVALGLSVISVVYSAIVGIVSQAIIEPVRLDSRLLNALWSFSASGSALLCLLVVLLAGPIEEVSGIVGVRFALLLLLAIVPLRILSRIPSGVLARDLRFRSLTIVQVVSWLIGYMGVSIALALAGFGIPALVLGMVAQEVLQLLMLLVATRGHLPSRIAGWRDIAESVRGYKIMSVGVSSSILQQHVDNFAVGYVLGSGGLGQYSRAYRLSSFPANTFTDAIGVVLFPSFARVRAQPERLVRAIAGGTFVAAVVMVPACVFLGLDAKSITLGVLGDQWRPSASALSWLAPAVLFRVGQRIAVAVQRALGLQKRLTALSIVNVILITAGAIVGAQWGLRGVGIGVFCALGIGFVLSVGAICRSLPGLGSALLPTALVTTLGVAFCSGVKAILRMVGIDGILSPLLGTIVATALLSCSAGLLVATTPWAATSWVKGQILTRRGVPTDEI